MGADAVKHDPRFEKLVNEVRPRIRECDCEAVKKRLDAGESFNLIDVRDRDEWDNGHLPSALHLSKGIIERDIGKVVPDEEADFAARLDAADLRRIRLPPGPGVRPRRRQIGCHPLSRPS